MRQDCPGVQHDVPHGTVHPEEDPPEVEDEPPEEDWQAPFV